MPIDTAILPSWASYRAEKDAIHVDMDTAYMRYLRLLDLAPTAFAAGVVRNCITRDLRALEPSEERFPVVRFKPLTPELREKWRSENLPNSGDPSGEDEQGFRAAGKYRAKLQAARAATALSQE